MTSILDAHFASLRNMFIYFPNCLYTFYIFYILHTCYIVRAIFLECNIHVVHV